MCKHSHVVVFKTKPCIYSYTNLYQNNDLWIFILSKIKVLDSQVNTSLLFGSRQCFVSDLCGALKKTFNDARSCERSANF